MPDMERLTRDLELHLAKDSNAQALVRAKHQATDKARWEVAAVAAFCAVVFVLIHVALNGLS